MGPVVSRKQEESVMGYLAKGELEGAQAILRGGKMDDGENAGGYFLKPSLLTGDADNICAREEILGRSLFFFASRPSRRRLNL